ncbi:4-alpha-glucanotransferase [candidate division MSBL1 archaeon SCGC-AAA382A03]|uniref:4-alpha-glucanotransferase n=1 Tax=candidate division MSBL1 archaeon SCGC-AAA382A03 TaxID=1698278 RepID=A0A133VD11_9EURY|nr:4-alpha-glucanotransferase [candidate division MSBL1 archaeon SCGC-AAA382A03]
MNRGSGILLHITSLPSPYGIGDLGPYSYEFADYLSETGQSFWQILPLNPTPPRGNPYHGLSAFAGNPLLISPETLIEKDLLRKRDIEPVPDFSEKRVEFEKVSTYKEKIFDKAYNRFKNTNNSSFEKFCKENKDWLDDYALFSALKDYYGENTWKDWPDKVKNREEQKLENLRKNLSDGIKREKFLQYTFFNQWFSLKNYCNKKGIRIFGDLPMYPNYDSVEVWCNPRFFKLDDEKKPKVVSGVPPDAFSETGQLWGHPIYDWEELKKTNYDWWLSRIKHKLNLYDLLRIDHFRGYVAYWEVPSEEKTAINGEWVDGPKEDLFSILLDKFPDFPFIAEDLGEITPDVIEFKNRLKIPGMRVLLFGFGENPGKNPHLPHNYVENSLACTGTHDTNTIKGWFENEASSEEKERITQYFGRKIKSSKIHQEFIRLVMMSISKIVSIPMQDLLGLGESARMNNPGENENNWEWRITPEQFDSDWSKILKNMTRIYGRYKESNQ